jgi:hypothetical protein
LIGGKLFLLGLAQGHWDIRPEDKNEPDPFAGRKDDLRVNMGIALVVPARKIRETLYHPDLVEGRKRSDQQADEARGATSSD